MSDYDETLHILNEVLLGVLVTDENERMYATVEISDPENVTAIICLTRVQVLQMAEFFTKAAEQMVDKEVVYN